MVTPEEFNLEKELEEINRVLTRIASLGKPLTADEFSAKLNEE